MHSDMDESQRQIEEQRLAIVKLEEDLERKLPKVMIWGTIIFVTLFLFNLFRTAIFR